MLSSQTKDPVTHEAMMNLRRSLPGGLTLESLRAATDEKIQQCICKVVGVLLMLMLLCRKVRPMTDQLVLQGFWRRKTEYLRKAADVK